MQVLVSGLFSAADSYGKGDAIFEIILMLLVAFILGYLLRYFLSKNRYADYEDLKHQNDLFQNQINEQTSQLAQLQSALDNCQQNTVLAFKSGEEPAHKDDLKVVEGIGPKIEQLLYEARIYTWGDLAEAEVAFIQSVLDKAGSRYKMHNPESWPFQAAMARDGKWDELHKWQDEHKAGRF